MVFRLLFSIILSSFLLIKSLVVFSLSIDTDVCDHKNIKNTVYIDSAHNNHHTKEGSYKPLADFLDLHGYCVKNNRYSFSELLPERSSILIISNALNPKNRNNWVKPIYEAFTELEIKQLKNWVREGGSLLLIADHMPFPGAADELASAFGFKFHNGFAYDTTFGLNANFLFTTANGTLKKHAVTTNGIYGNKVDTVATFLGQGFSIPGEAVSLLELPASVVSIMPEVAWKIDETTPRISLKGMSQGALMNFGMGKIAVFGEAAMFTHQEIELPSAHNITVGFNAPHASQNKTFILNLLNWLSDK